MLKHAISNGGGIVEARAAQVAMRFPPSVAGRPVRRMGTIVDENGEPHFKRMEEDDVAVAPSAEPEFVISDDETDYDTPAFLRRQAE